eukprot:TRINITY_DN87421_c0_g1_i1.p1 TRINITY_DN87421_c0_g1~~TRINITY_DN87421_c0_g1_i1.p1  ORF type:complete len:247 (+),score=33.80 TRINITY_DN87421_c0_g1_i1:46-786(+)
MHRLWALLLAAVSIVALASDLEADAKDAETVAVAGAEESIDDITETASTARESRRLGWRRWNRYRPECFVGDATVNTPHGKVMLKDLRLGNSILTGSGVEDVLGFLHSTNTAESGFVSIWHFTGELRVSFNHVLLTTACEKLARDVVVGDELLTVTGKSRVLGVQVDFTDQGLFAPLTRSGIVTVDSVQASNYASVGSLQISHSAMHAAFFLVRAFAPFDSAARGAVDYAHPPPTRIFPTSVYTPN